MTRDYSAEEIIFPQAKLQWSEKQAGVLELYFEDGLIMSLEQAISYNEAIKKMTAARNQNIFVYIDGANLKGLSKEARQYFSQASTSRSRACALLVGNGISRVLGNFLVGFNRPQTPTRLFTHKEKALAWLAEWQNKDV